MDSLTRIRSRFLFRFVNVEAGCLGAAASLGAYMYREADPALLILAGLGLFWSAFAWWRCWR